MGRGRACAWWGRSPRQRWQTVFTAGEIALWLAVFAFCRAWDRLTHFTWWGIIFHVCVLATSLVADRPWWGEDVAVQCTVIVGVWYMSACSCTMLTDAESEMGAAAYAAGNFLVHYVPIISALARWNGGKGQPTAVLLWVLYNTAAASRNDPVADVYGCDVPREVVLVLGTLAAGGASLAFEE